MNIISIQVLRKLGDYPTGTAPSNSDEQTLAPKHQKSTIFPI